jgi:hypothetical protein
VRRRHGEVAVVVAVVAGHEDEPIHHPDDAAACRRGVAHLAHRLALSLDDVLLDARDAQLRGDDVGDGTGRPLAGASGVRTSTSVQVLTRTTCCGHHGT